MLSIRNAMARTISIESQVSPKQSQGRLTTKVYGICMDGYGSKFKPRINKCFLRVIPINWHSIWHMFWHVFWHSILHSIYANILSGILSDIIIFWHPMTFFLACVRVRVCPDWAGARHKLLERDCSTWVGSWSGLRVAGVHSADELAEGGRRRGRGGGCGEGVRAGVTVSKSRGPHPGRE